MSIKSTIVFNLGLENNPFNADENRHLLKTFGELVSSEIVISEYQGESERTLVAEISAPWFPIEQLIAGIRTLAIKTTQECIAVRIDGVGYVIGSWEKYDMDFNADYFVGA